MAATVQIRRWIGPTDSPNQVDITSINTRANSIDSHSVGTINPADIDTWAIFSEPGIDDANSLFGADLRYTYDRFWRMNLGDGGDNGAEMFYSFDGINWTKVLLPNIYLSISQLPAYGRGPFNTNAFVTLAIRENPGSSTISTRFPIYSYNGYNWFEEKQVYFQGGPRGIASNGGSFVAINNDSVQISNNGVEWELVTVTKQGSSGPYESSIIFSSIGWRGLVYGNGIYVAVSNPNGLGDVYATAASTDNGNTWSEGTLPSVGRWRDPAYGNGLFVTVESRKNSSPYETARAAISTDGITWTEQTLPANAWWDDVTFGDGRFVAIGRIVVESSGVNVIESHIAAISDDGITWTLKTLPDASPFWTRVVYGNGIFIMLEYNSDRHAISANTTGAVTIPNSGTNYSYWVATRLYATVPPMTVLDNIRWHTNGGGFGTGINTIVNIASSYKQATGLYGSTGDELNKNNYFALSGEPVDAFTNYPNSTTPLTVPGSLSGFVDEEATGDVGFFVVYQITVDNTASPGGYNSETFTWLYDET